MRETVPTVPVPPAENAAAEVALPGGTAHNGQVTRRGGIVRRPAGPYTPAVHALLQHLAARGFVGAPRPLGTQDEVELLTYLEGDSAYFPGRPGTMPLPDWAQTDAAMISVAHLLRRFHEASASFDPTPWSWQRSVPSPWAGTRVTHNDTHPANVIFRDGAAVALIDFDLAGPGSVAFELAVAACFWVPILAPADVHDSRGGRLYERFGLFLDAYEGDRGAAPSAGGGRGLRAEVVRALPPANDWIYGIIREAAERGHPAFGRMWAIRAEMAQRATTFVKSHHAELAAAAAR